VSTDDGAILLLDDDPMVTRSLAALLGEETTCRVVALNRPAEALAALAERPFDVVVADFLMPEMDGLRVLAHARETQPQASRILLTGYADKASAIRSINEVALYQYVEKPWDNDALLLVLRNAVERSRLVRELERQMLAFGRVDRSLVELRARLLKALA